MIESNWIPLQGIPATGKTILLESQDFWQSACKEFGLECTIREPVSAKIDILPQQEGVLFRGRIHGNVVMPCDRCARDSIFSLAHSFDSFEPFPADMMPGQPPSAQEENLSDGSDEAVIRSAAHGRGIEINPSALAWQEFCLALPVKPLCEENCLGLCPVCGVNKNTEDCSCTTTEGDPRLAALRGLKLHNKK